jgi:transposase InsO family protein
MPSAVRMPWRESDAVNERLKFVVGRQSGRSTMTELCRRFGVSRKTGYKILDRYARDGPEGLRDRSRAPITHPNQTPPEIEAAILRVRKAYPTWGSKKIVAVLRREWPEMTWPARSTVDMVLKRAGLVSPRRCRRRAARSQPFVDALEPNDYWSIDYKGWFRVGDGTRCDPLTVNDVCSRASLECRAMVSPKLEDVRCQLQLTFGRFGLPRLMLSDNGPPFASTGLGGLSRLGVWLLRLGIQPVFIQPGHPEQNGRHERFHETLKAETATPPRATVRAQQIAFDKFQVIYNEERPHEALEMSVPAEVYELSSRSMPDELAEHEYPDGLEVRRVQHNGCMKWKGKRVFVGEAMRGESIGLDPVDDGVWHVHLGPMHVGVFQERAGTVVTPPCDGS